MPALSLSALHGLIRRDDSGGTTTPSINLGNGSKPGGDFNNAVFLGLFASISALMVMACFWFFFYAKNGGFRWKKNDWEDYKSTVLRRKGPDGKTLSNATKSTRLGGGSEAPTFDDRGMTGRSEWDAGEMREIKDYKDNGSVVSGLLPGKKGDRKSSRHDPELAAYKSEKAAKVGGINSRAAGSHYDHTNTDLSVASSYIAKSSKNSKKAAKEAERQQKIREKEAIKAEKKARKEHQQNQAAAGTIRAVPASQSPPAYPAPATSSPTKTKQQRSAPSAAYSFVSGDDDESVYTSTNTFSEYTSMTAPKTAAASETRSYYYDQHYRPNAALGPISEVSSVPSSQRRLIPEAKPLVEPASGRYRRSGVNSPSHEENRHRNSASNHNSPRHSPAPSRQSSPRKTDRPASSSRYTPVQNAASSVSEDSGTKVYPCYIPGVSRRDFVDNISPMDSVSQVGARMYHQQQREQQSRNDRGYRRGGGRSAARDELSEEEEY